MKKTLTITIDYLEFALPADTTRADVAKIVALLTQMKRVDYHHLGEHRADGEPTSHRSVSTTAPSTTNRLRTR
jgi:hypothetical protein